MGARLSFPRVPLPEHHIVLVTGGNVGIGYHTAKWIAMMGATVIIACRSEERALKAIEQMNEEFQILKKQGTEKLADYDKLHVEFMKLDCASLKNTKDFIDTFQSSGRKLNTLICNAGMSSVTADFTEDGNEQLFQVNYLSHFLIIAHLLPIMEESGDDVRIISLSSFAHVRTYFDQHQIQLQKDSRNYEAFQTYARSKLYQIMHMFALNRRLVAAGKKVTINALHPGFVETDILKQFTAVFRCCFFNCLRCFRNMKTPFEGSWTSINAAVNPELKGIRDVYFANSTQAPESVSRDARNVEYQEMLWRYSKECLKDYLTDDLIKYIEGR